MKLCKRILSFLLVFCLTAAVAAVAAMAYDGAADAPLTVIRGRMLPQSEIPTETPPTEDVDEHLAVSGAKAFSPRLTAPSYENEYYYSDKNIFYKYGWGMPNCTCYAWGRAYEILGTQPDLSVYSAYLWYDYNRENECYAYGSTPKLGAVACWVYSWGTSGHVAVVEKIENGTITFSNSAYGGEEFYLSTAPVSDPSNGRSNWIFQGYIYIGEYDDSSPSVPEEPKEEGDVYRIISDNGVNFRSGAGTSYDVIGAIPFGKTVTVTRTAYAEGYLWGYCNYGGKYGWFVTDFAELIYRHEPGEPENPPDDTRYLMGDVDGDGVVSVLDASRIQRVLAKYDTPTMYVITVGDFDGDNQMTVIDAVKIQKKLAGVRY